MRTNPGSNYICSHLSVKGQGHLSERKPKALLPLSDPIQTKHDHKSSPQVAAISLVSTTGPDMTSDVPYVALCLMLHTIIIVFALFQTNKQVFQYHIILRWPWAW